MNAKRTRVFLEIATIEKQYVADLLFVINEFKQPLVRERIITPAESGKIFSNIETICKIHLSINESLRNHRKLWGLKSSIAECFIDEVSKLEAYKTYIPPFDEAMELLRTLRTTNPQFNKFLKTMEGSKKMRHMELPDLLIKPVQRIPRYILLFREYLKFTPPNHPDYELVPKLIHYLDSTLRDINSFRRRSINEAKINFLQSSVSGANLSGLTEYAMEGELLRVNVTNPVKMYVFLFDEMFIMAKQSPEKSDTPVISSISSRISKFLNTKTYRFKLRKTIKVPNIISVSSDDQDADGKSFRLTVARKGMKHEIAQRVSSKRADFKVYHFKTQSEKLQMTWTGTITKLLLQYQTQIARAQTW